MSDQNDNVINLGQKKVDQDRINAAAKAINNPEVPEQFLSQMVDEEFPEITDSVKLPSGGLFYPGKQSTVKIKHLTAEDENILTSPELIRNGKVLDVLLDNAIIDDSLHSSDMVVGDRNAVLMELRKEGYGDDYEVKIGCPSCGQDFNTVVKISDIETKFISVKPDSNGEFYFLLPKSGWEVKFRLLFGKDEDYLMQVSGRSKKLKSGASYSKTLTERLLLQIMEINGKRDKIYIKKAIESMPVLDSSVLRNYMGEVEPGLILESNYTCTNCTHNFDGDIPITPKLFWPNAKI